MCAAAQTVSKPCFTLFLKRQEMEYIAPGSRQRHLMEEIV